MVSQKSLQSLQKLERSYTAGVTDQAVFIRGWDWRKTCRGRDFLLQTFAKETFHCVFGEANTFSYSTPLYTPFSPLHSTLLYFAQLYPALPCSIPPCTLPFYPTLHSTLDPTVHPTVHPTRLYLTPSYSTFSLIR